MKSLVQRAAFVTCLAAAMSLSSALASAAVISPSSWDFGNQPVGTSSAPKTFSVSPDQFCFHNPITDTDICTPNPSTAVTPVGVTGPFVLTSNCLLFAPCNAIVTYLPVSPGLTTGTLSAGSGTINLRGTGTAGTGSGGAGGGVLQGAQASNTFSFGGLKLNKHTGTATLTVEVPGPGDVSLGGNGLVKQRPGATSSKALPSAGTIKLKVKAKGPKKAKLNKTGKAKVKPKITFSPTGGAPATQTRKVTLRKNV